MVLLRIYSTLPGHVAMTLSSLSTLPLPASPLLMSEKCTKGGIQYHSNWVHVSKPREYKLRNNGKKRYSFFISPSLEILRLIAKRVAVVRLALGHRKRIQVVGNKSLFTWVNNLKFKVSE